MSKKKLKQHLEFTPWWRSKEAFDFLNMKPWDKFNQQAVIHPSTRSPVTDLCKIVMGKPSTCRPLIQIITCFIIYQNSIPLKTTTKRCYFCTFSFLLLITKDKQKWAARGRKQHQFRWVFSPWWPCPRGLQSSSQTTVNATERRRLRPLHQKFQESSPQLPDLGEKPTSPLENFLVKGLPLAESKREE